MNPLNAVICTLNSKYIHSSLAPWCLLAGVRTYCDVKITATVVEGTINGNPEEICKRIVEKCPQVIGFGCYIWNISETIALIGMIKNHLPYAIIVLGGPEVSYNAENVLRENPSVDYILSGEGEKPFALLLNSIQNGEKIEGLPGLCYRKDEKIMVSQPYVSEETPPSPYTEEYFNSLNGRIAYLETSRGCPYSCAFCLSGRCGNVRFFDMERAEKELVLLAKSGTQTVKLVDRTFNTNRKRAYELFDFIIKNYGGLIPEGICFHFEIAGDLLNEETIKLLSTAPVGAIQFEIGLQSFNTKTLETINRKTDINRLKRNIKQLVENANMHIHIDLIAGLPFENMQSFAESFNTAYGLGPHMLQLGFLKILYGAPMYENKEKFPCKYAEVPPYEVTETPWLSEKELRNLHRTEDALDRLYNSGRFKNTLCYLIQKCSYSPFRLFYDFGIYCDKIKIENIPLDDYTAIVFRYFAEQENVEPIILRDAMVCDRLQTVATGLLPEVLRIKDPLLKKVKTALNNHTSTCQPKGVKRGIAILYSEKCAVYADYQNKNPITGEYKLNRYYYDNITREVSSENTD